MQPEVLNQLKNEIHNKCVAYDYNDATDTTLSDFVVNLLLVNKSAQEVNEEMINLVGNDYDTNLTNWIFERKNELENPQQAAPVQQQQQQQQKEQVVDIQEESMDVAPRIAKPERENRIFTKAIGSVIGHVTRNERSFSSQRQTHRSRSRSRSPERQSSRREPDRYSSRSEDRHSYRRQDDRSPRHGQDRHRSGDIFSRLGNSTSSTSRAEDNGPSVFDRLGGSKPIPAPQTTQDTRNERCKYWPNCKNGAECIYFHPTTVCPDFPNCPKKAIECMFIHPEVSKPIVMPQVKKLPVPCKFFPYCTNPLCPYMHPAVPQYMQTKPSFAATGQRVQIPCKNGDACTRPDCHFIHPKDPPAPQSEIICKFDGACTRPGCFYKHTKENAINKPSTPTSSRQFSVAEDEVEERIPVGESADIIITSQEQLHAMDMDSDVVMDAN